MPYGKDLCTTLLVSTPCRFRGAKGMLGQVVAVVIPLVEAARYRTRRTGRATLRIPPPEVAAAHAIAPHLPRPTPSPLLPFPVVPIRVTPRAAARACRVNRFLRRGIAALLVLLSVMVSVYALRGTLLAPLLREKEADPNPSSVDP